MARYTSEGHQRLYSSRSVRAAQKTSFEVVEELDEFVQVWPVSAIGASEWRHRDTVMSKWRQLEGRILCKFLGDPLPHALLRCVAGRCCEHGDGTPSAGGDPDGFRDSRARQSEKEREQAT